jgi:hypothetical protein
MQRFPVPAALLKAGENQIAITLVEGKATSVTYLDLAIFMTGRAGFRQFASVFQPCIPSPAFLKISLMKCQGTLLQIILLTSTKRSKCPRAPRGKLKIFITRTSLV